MEYWQLFLSFFRIGMIGYGGGPSLIPLFHYESVNKYKWVSAQEFADYLALCNALPGPLATKMASYIGYRVKGWLGSVIAITALTIPMIIGMIVLLSVIHNLKEMAAVNRMIQAIQPVIGTIMAVLAYECLTDGWQELKNKGGFIGFTIVSALAILYFAVHPGILIVIALTGSFIYSTWYTRKRRKEATQKWNKGA